MSAAQKGWSEYGATGRMRVGLPVQVSAGDAAQRTVDRQGCLLVGGARRGDDMRCASPAQPTASSATCSAHPPPPTRGQERIDMMQRVYKQNGSTQMPEICATPDTAQLCADPTMAPAIPAQSS